MGSRAAWCMRGKFGARCHMQGEGKDGNREQPPSTQLTYDVTSKR